MNKYIKVFLFCLILLLLWTKALLYILHQVPFGYDPGFYKAFFDTYFNAIPVFDYQSIDIWIRRMYEPFLGFFSVVLQLIWYSSEFLLGYGIVFFSSIVSVFVYLVLKPYGKEYAYIGVVIFLLSIIQYQTFWRSYYKQIFWIIFILTSIFLVHNKQYLVLIPVLIASFTVQRPTGVFLLWTLLIYIIAQFLLTKKIPIYLMIVLGISGGIAIFFYLPFFDTLILPLIQPLTKSVFISWSSGTFFSIYEYIYYARPFLLFALFGLVFKIRLYKRLDMIDSWFIFWIIWLLLRLFFYNRMIIFVDIFSILLVAYALWYLFRYQWGKYLVLVFVLVQGFWYWSYLMANNFPLAQKSELVFLSSLKYTLPKDSLMIVTNSNYTPWVIWYTWFPTMAPWLLDRDPWTKKDWIAWRNWDWKFKCDFFRSTSIQKEHLYMYIWVHQKRENLHNQDCLTLLYTWPGYYLFSLNLKSND